MLTEILIVVSLLVMNGVFASAEIAVLSVRKTRITELVEQGVKGAAAVAWLRRQPERFLATVQIGITVVGTTAAAFGGDSLAERGSAWLASHAPWLGEGAHRLAFALVIVFVSFLEIVIGELVPKSLALRHAERFSVTLGPMLRAMASLVKPLVRVFTGASNVVLRLFGDHTSFSEARLSPDELQELVEEAGRTGAIDPGASEIASRAIAFRELVASDVMVPRSRIVAIARDASVDVVRALLAERRFATLPVYEGDRENIVGCVALKDLVLPALAGHPLRGARVRPPVFVPGGMPAMALLRRMQTERFSLAFLIDERGTLLGMVTLEDLLEEVVGDILGDADPVTPSLVRDDAGAITMPGETYIRDVNRATGAGLPEPDSVSTVAGLCIEAAGRLPAAGDRIELSTHHVFEVLDVSPRKIRSVRLHPPAPAARSVDEPDDADDEPAPVSIARDV